MLYTTASIPVERFCTSFAAACVPQVVGVHRRCPQGAHGRDHDGHGISEAAAAVSPGRPGQQQHTATKDIVPRLPEAAPAPPGRGGRAVLPAPSCSRPGLTGYCQRAG
jgi:hypothetical protein